MAQSSRKKQDENNMKTLRELGALPQNKFCFDCGQRGPTYVNVTIGSFVCTKCSGMLRGLTPPHRVKSISMSAFTQEEIDTLREKGNDYCRRTWLGLYEGTLPSQTDEQGVRDFMVEKYERKRYFLEKSMTHHESNRPHLNGSTKTQINGCSRSNNMNNNKHQQNGVGRPQISQNGTTRSRPEVKNSSNNNLSNGFKVDFDHANIFSNGSTNSSQSSSTTGTPQNGFANFDNNSVFDSTTTSNKDNLSTNSPWSVQQPKQNQPAQVNNIFPTLNGITPLITPPQSNNKNINGIPPNITNGVQPLVNNINGLPNGMTVHSHIPNLTQPTLKEDKYAALKNLDEEMKTQNQQGNQHQDIWINSNGGSTGSLYSYHTPNTGSAYGSPSSQGSMIGSPSTNQFSTAFPDNFSNGPSNPFNTAWSSNPMQTPSNNNGFAKFNGNLPNGLHATSNGINGYGAGVAGTTNGLNGQTQPFANPFKQPEQNMNGFANFGSIFPPQQTGLMVNGGNDAWGANPFKVSSATGVTNSSNPFL